jgi:hypothetical protein
VEQINKISPLIMFLTLFLSFGTSATHAQTAQEIAKKAFDSTVLLVMEDTNGQPLSLGSGFFVSGGEIASNLHVVEGAARGYGKLVGQKTKFDIEGVTAIDAERDLVMLKISHFDSQALSLGNSDNVQVGDSVYAVGNPQGLEGTFSQGIVSSIREIGTNKLLQITAPISPGSSGGPVLNDKGEVIGVSVATFKGGQNLNFAIPAKYLKAMLGKKGPVKPLAQVKSTIAQSSITGGLGGRSSEGVTGERVTWDSYTQSGEYSLSLHNQLREAVRGIYCLVIFYDSKDSTIDFSVINYPSIIPAGLSKRIKGRVEGITEQLNSPPLGGFHGSHPSWQPPRTPRSKVEVRTLNFEIVN